MSFGSSTSSHQGFCPVPFLQESTFPLEGGFIPGRFCMPISPTSNLTCCLPCPMTDWAYPDGFDQRTEIANWVNVVAFILSLFLILSFIVLPVKYTHRHYLSFCLTIGVVLIELAFIVPLATNPDQCFNEITPNDMRSSGTCAISGAFLLFGGWAVIIWVFYRALHLHLQICWEVVPGNKFFYSALLFGWGIPAVGLALTSSLTGWSFRFGNICHINHKNALEDFWGPLLAFAALSMVLQFITLGYCVQVFVKSLLDDSKNSTNSSSQLPTYNASIRTSSARQTYRRVKRVIELQWRGACIVLLIIAEVVFFSVVFVSMDNSVQINDDLLKKATPWLTCLVTHRGDKDQCLDLAHGLTKSEGIVMAVLICLGFSGFWCLVFLGRWTMVLGWKDLIQRHFLTSNEFVSADARRMSDDTRTYEMISGSTTPQLNIKTPDRAMTPATGTGAPTPLITSMLMISPQSSTVNSPFSPQSADPDSKQDYFGKSRAYHSPASSYSTPRPPSAGQYAYQYHYPRDWDSRMSHARSSNTPTPAPAYTRYNSKDFDD